MADRLADGRLLTVDLDGHVAIGDSACATEAATRYLVDLAPPGSRRRAADPALRLRGRRPHTVPVLDQRIQGDTVAWSSTSPQVHDAVERRHPGPRVHRLAGPAPHLRPGGRAHQPPRQPPDRAGASARAPSATELGGHESGQDHLACYLHNGNEYLEAHARRLQGPGRAVQRQLPLRRRGAALPAATTPGREGIVFHSTFAPTARRGAPRPARRSTVLLQVDDDSGRRPARRAPSGTRTHSPAQLARRSCRSSGQPRRPLHPLHRRHHRHAQGRAVAPGRHLRRRHGRPEPRPPASEWDSLDEIVEAAVNGGARLVPAPPFMHGAGHWLAFNAFTGGSTICIQDDTIGLDADDVLAHHRAREGEHPADRRRRLRPPARRRARGRGRAGDPYDLSSHADDRVGRGAAELDRSRTASSPQLPTVMVMDARRRLRDGQPDVAHERRRPVGQHRHLHPRARRRASSARTSSTALEAGHEEIGWLAQKGRVPLGYLGDAEKTARTFPVIDGVRYSVPGDRARLTADGDHRAATGATR